MKQGIYFLYDAEELVYIGKTINRKNRFMVHDHIGQYTKFKFLKVDNLSDLSILELAYIDKYKPIKNKQDKFTSTSSIDLILVDIELLPLMDMDVQGKITLFPLKGHKMYKNGVELLLNVLTSKEALRITRIYNGTNVDMYNILTKPFRAVTADMKPNKRSVFKHKLIDTTVIVEYNNKIFINPFIFVPRRDKNVKNSQYLTQRLWKYIVEDVNSANVDVVQLAEQIFGKPEGKPILVGIGKHNKDSIHKKWVE